jgi:hypothetical protein
VPLPGVLGLRSAWRRPGRLLTNAAGLTLGVAMIVVALALRDSLELLALTPAASGQSARDAAVAILYDQIWAVRFGTAGLLVLATINAVIVATFAARDAARNHAVMRALGATPRQTVTADRVAARRLRDRRRGRHPARPWPVEPWPVEPWPVEPRDCSAG